MKIDTIQTSFAGGEFASSLVGRTDIAQYSNACATVENFLVRPYGSLISAPGTEFINDSKYSIITNTSSTLVFYLKFESSFIDSSTYNHSPLVTGATIDNSFYNVGSGSGQFIASSSHSVSYINNSVFDLSNNDFEIGCRFSLSSVTHNNIHLNIVSKGYPDNGGTSGFKMGVFNDFGYGYKLFFVFREDGIGDTALYSPFFIPNTASSPSIGVTMIANTFYNYKVVRSNGYIRFYLNGDEIPMGANNSPSPSYGYNVSTNAVVYGTDRIIVGAQRLSGSGMSGFYDGNIDELYIFNNSTGQSPSGRLYGRSRLIPFVFSRDDAYIIEAGTNYFRFYTDGAVVNA